MTVHKGDIVQRPVRFMNGASRDNTTARLMRGVVVYVHPKGRFHTVQFGEGEKAVRESFPGVEK